MGKTDFISRFGRRDFLIRFWGTFLTVLALPSAVLTIVGRHISMRLTGALVAFALVLAVVLNRHRLVTKIVPPGIAPEEFELRRIHCPCDLKLTDEAGQLAEECFGRETISASKFEPLRVKNPHILACMTGAQGNFLGYFDVIPLRDDFGALFLKGRVTEKDITHEDVLEPAEMSQCKYLYLSGLAVRHWETYTGHYNALILVWALLKYLDHFYQDANAIAFAVGFTAEGAHLLETFRLKLEADALSRIDKHPAYSISLSREEILQRLACVPDYSSICSLDWAPKSDAVPSPPLTPDPKVPFKSRRVPLPSRSIRTLPSPTTRAMRYH